MDACCGWIRIRPSSPATFKEITAAAVGLLDFNLTYHPPVTRLMPGAQVD